MSSPFTDSSSSICRYFLFYCVLCERFFSQADDDSSTSYNVTMADITQFQLNMWTGVGLALAGFFAIYATFNMDVQPDSLLYAKFITDTTGGGLKTD